MEFGARFRAALPAARWLLAAALLWLAGSLSAPSTPVEIASDGGQIHLTVAGSTLTAPIAVASVHRISIRAMDSVFPPGGRTIEILEDGRALLEEELPRRFCLPPGQIMPLGDWELDERAGAAEVYAREVDLSGPFEVRARFTGRVHHDLTVALDGEPRVAVSFRRGLINNDLFIRDGRGEIVAATSIDPEPLSSLIWAASIVLRAGAVAALLIALFSAIDRLAPARREERGPRSLVRTRWAVAAACGLAVAAGATSAWLAADVLERLPHLPDSTVYLLQASWLLDGRLFQEVTPIQRHLTIPFTYVVDGRWVAHYPFGWPLLLAAGVAAGHPWLVAPVLAALYTVLLFLVGRELYGPAVAVMAVALATLSPVSRLLFASMLSHAAAATLVLLFLWLLLVARRTGSMLPALAAGVALGLAFGVRPATAVAVALPAGGLLAAELVTAARGARTGRLLAATALGGAAATTPTILCNLLVTGSGLGFPYTLARGSMYALDNLAFGLRNLDTILASLVPALYGWGWGYAALSIFLALPLAFALIPFLLRRHGPADLLLAGCFLAVVAAHVFARGHGLHGFGPRYWFEALFALHLLTARGFQALAAIGPSAGAPGFGLGRRGGAALSAAALFAALNGSAAVKLPERLGLYRAYNRIDRSLVEQVETLGIDRGLILFADRNWRDWAMAAPMMDSDPRAPLAFAQSLEDDRDLLAFYSDRPVYVWRDRTLAPRPGP